MTEDEFLRIYDQFAPRILGYCAFRLGARLDAEDVTAEAFARLLARPNLIAPERVSSWLFTVAGHLCTDQQRRARRAGEMPDPPPEQAEEPVWVDLQLRDALSALNAAQQQVFFLRVIEDMSFADIGRLLGRRETAVKMQYHRAVRRARRALEEVESCSRSSLETL